MSSVLKAASKTVMNSDLYERGYGEAGVDFMRATRRAGNISIPPHDCAEGSVRAGLHRCKRKFALFPRFVRTLALLLAGCLVLAHAAAAQSVADTVSRWGLLGTWALDCTKPASSSNGYLSYVVRAGRVLHERNFGDKRDANDVQQAKTGAGGALEIVVHFPQLLQTRKYTMIMGPDRRTRAMANSRIDGAEQTIKDGKFIHNGAETPWQSRCH